MGQLIRADLAKAFGALDRGFAGSEFGSGLGAGLAGGFGTWNFGNGGSAGCAFIAHIFGGAGCNVPFPTFPSRPSKNSGN
jgi:hypothetical protein